MNTSVSSTTKRSRKSPVTTSIINFLEKSYTSGHAIASASSTIAKNIGASENSVKTLLYKLQRDGKVSYNKDNQRWSFVPASNSF